MIADPSGARRAPDTFLAGALGAPAFVSRPRGSTGAALGLLLALGACRAPGASSTAPTAAALELAWSVEPERVTGSLQLASDGSGSFTAARVEGYEEVQGEPVTIGQSAARRALLAGAWSRLGELPRYAHGSSGFSGVSVELHLAGADREVAHRSRNYWHPALADFARDLSAVLDEPARGALRPLVELERFQGAPRFEFTPGRTPTSALLAPLSPPATDVELRHLAARLCAEQAAYELVPALRAEFERSHAADGEGDYFLARALLELGEPCGLRRVAAVALSAHPEWAAEAGGSLERAFGRPVVPGWDGTGEDPRPAAVGAFLAWFEEARGRLSFDRARQIYAERADGAAR